MHSVSYSLGLGALVRGLCAQRALIGSMSRRDIRQRYKGSSIGLLWSLITPLLLLAAYTAVFGGIFRSRWGGAGSTTEFALQLFCGLTLHTLVADCLTQSATKLIAHASYVKRVVFPLEILPVIVVVNALFHAAVSLLILVLAKILLLGGAGWPMLALPLVLAPLVLLCLGLSWFFGATTVYLRDLAQVTPLLTMLLLFLSPIFYPIQMVPAFLQPIILFSPLTIPVEQLRAIIMANQWPDWTLLGVYGLVSLAAAWCGYAWFQKTRKGFADVL